MNNKKNIILIVILLLLVMIGCFLIFMKPKIKIIYNGKEIDNEITIDVNSDFVLPLYKAEYLGKNITNKVKVEGSVDNNKIGSYKVKYNVQELIYNIDKIQTVNVVDQVKPEIILNGDNPSNSCSIQSYVEEGYTASDNYDGDITSNVTIERIDGIVKYSVKDSSNNEYTTERKIVVNDVTPPKIELKGKSAVRVVLNGSYTDEGVSASDNCDTEITNIETDNKVDYTKVGVYEIIYTATDSSGNSSSVKRYIYIYDPKTSASTNGGEKGVIYLTFDDGPSVYTPKILDILAKYDIKATFFVTNSGKDSVIKREYKEGHTVALHTASHSYKKIYSSVDNYFKDLESVQNRVYKIINEKPMIIRFPGGSSNTVSKSYSKGIMTVLTNEVLVRGYHYFDWTSAVEDAGSCASKKSEDAKEKCVYDYFKKGLSKKRSNVVLMHDIKSYTASKLEDMIKYALDKGYTFDKITMDTAQIHHKVNN